MPPKTKFPKETVIEAAIEVVRRQGIQELSARSVAAQLKSSTAPVYSYFETMAELEREALIAIRNILYDYMTKSYTDRIFLNMGLGMARFARDNCQLYHALFANKSGKQIIYGLHGLLEKEMAKDTRLADLTVKQRHALLVKMSIFTHGLSTLICTGLIEDDSEQFIKQTLIEVGSAVIGAALAKSEQTGCDNEQGK
jgi:AcrR family transcriptional regulator